MRTIFLCLLALPLTISTGCGGTQAKSDTTAAATTTAGGPAADKLPESATCPVMKSKFKPTDKTVTAMHNGTKYYFCCPGCDKKFAANPEKYLAAGPAAAGTPKAKPCAGDCTDDCADCANPNKVAKTNENGVKMMTGADLGDALPASAKCSVSGREFKPSATTKIAEYKGKKHYFCCGGCAGKFANAPEQFASN